MLILVGVEEGGGEGLGVAGIMVERRRGVEGTERIVSVVLSALVMGPPPCKADIVNFIISKLSERERERERRNH